MLHSLITLYVLLVSLAFAAAQAEAVPEAVVGVPTVLGYVLIDDLPAAEGTRPGFSIYNVNGQKPGLMFEVLSDNTFRLIGESPADGVPFGAGRGEFMVESQNGHYAFIRCSMNLQVHNSEMGIVSFGFRTKNYPYNAGKTFSRDRCGRGSKGGVQVICDDASVDCSLAS